MVDTDANSRHGQDEYVGHSIRHRTNHAEPFDDLMRWFCEHFDCLGGGFESGLDSLKGSVFG